MQKEKHEVVFMKGIPFPIGTTVYYIKDKNEVDSIKIRSYKSEISTTKKDDEEIMFAHLESATCEFLFVHGDYFEEDNENYGYDQIPLHRIFRDEVKAAEQAKFTEISFPEDVWVKAVGKRSEYDNETNTVVIPDEGEDAGESELGTCCSSISRVRDLIYKAQRCGGLIRQDIQDIVDNLHGHYEWNEVESPNLLKILAALGINREDING